MLKIGITGRHGFIGDHTFNMLGLFPEEFERIDFDRNFFANESNLDLFVEECDVIIHLAAVNRHESQEELYNINVGLAKKLIDSLERTGSTPHIIMSSSSQEEKDNLYGKSKKEARNLFSHWANKNKATFTGMIIPNVFGPFGKPFYNSVVATFSHQIASNETPTINVDGVVNLIYVSELAEEFINVIRNKANNFAYIVKHTYEIKVSEILALLKSFKVKYQDAGEIPNLNNRFELNLFNTFRCYIDIKSQFPIKYTQHTDPRGSFVEIIRLGIGGQVSFSTTVPDITRGNHFHTRKIERFSVIKGKALIQLRRIGTEEVLDFYLDGDNPSYVDMPIWYTHNIKNIGEEVLYTNFWINEPYNPEDADTYFENV